MTQALREYPRFLWRCFRLSFVGDWKYYTWMFVLSAITLLGLNAYAKQLVHGLIITGMTDQVSWGLYIANFTYLVGVAAAAVMHAAAADAITIPSQASTGGLGRESGKGQASSNATMEGYTLEGTAKGGHSPKVKFGVMADARAAAEAAAVQSVSAPAKK